MNVDKANQLADFIEKHTELEWGINRYATCFCTFANLAGMTPEHELDKQLECTNHGEIGKLICPPGWMNSRFYTRERAVRTLRNFAVTGEVNWDLPAEAPVKVLELV